MTCNISIARAIYRIGNIAGRMCTQNHELTTRKGVSITHRDNAPARAPYLWNVCSIRQMALSCNSDVTDGQCTQEKWLC